MDHRSPSFEASLLYKTAPTPTIDSMLDDIRAVIEINGETLQHVDKNDDLFTVLTCNAVQILLAVSHRPLPVGHYLNAHRPAAAQMGETQILARLTDIEATTTIVIVDKETTPGSAPAPDNTLKRDLCWDITECLFQQGPTELVFWSADDILFADEEFGRACAYATRQTEELTKETIPLEAPAHRIFDHDPVVDDAALSGIISKAERKLLRNALSEPLDAQNTGKILSFPLAKSLTGAFGRLQKNVTLRRAQNSTALACTAVTVAVSDMHNLAQLMA